MRIFNLDDPLAKSNQVGANAHCSASHLQTQYGPSSKLPKTSYIQFKSNKQATVICISVLRRHSLGSSTGRDVTTPKNFCTGGSFVLSAISFKDSKSKA